MITLIVESTLGDADTGASVHIDGGNIGGIAKNSGGANVGVGLYCN